MTVVLIIITAGEETARTQWPKAAAGRAGTRKGFQGVYFPVGVFQQGAAGAG